MSTLPGVTAYNTVKRVNVCRIGNSICRIRVWSRKRKIDPWIQRVDIEYSHKGYKTDADLQLMAQDLMIKDWRKLA